MNGWRSCTVAHWLSSSSDSSAPPLGRRVTRYPLRPNRKRAKIDVVTSRMILVAALAACTYPTHFEDCTVRCAADAECPNDLACGPEGLCRTPGAEETCARVLGTFPSCAGLAPTCGPNADEDCCSTALPIPGGTFYRSYDVAADGMYPSTSYPATVSAFQLDRFEVTVGRFRKFIESGGGTRARPLFVGAGARRLNGADGQGGWDASWNASLAADTNALAAALKCDGSFQTWTDAPGANEELPINCVTWYEAFAFCAWDGGFLPTEAEWNFAAAGGDEQRAYPWSSPASAMTIDCSYANYGGSSFPMTACTVPGAGAPRRIGSPNGDGRWGQTDLAGNAFEWTLDWYVPSYLNPCNDCADLVAGTSRVLRGGGWDNSATNVRAGYRLDRPPTLRHQTVGIRCARILGAP